jgi:hypothetical protein
MYDTPRSGGDDDGVLCMAQMPKNFQRIMINNYSRRMHGEKAKLSEKNDHHLLDVCSCFGSYKFLENHNHGLTRLS